MRIKRGDVVSRISYGKDILFIVDRIIVIPKGENIAILKGLSYRIEADSLVSDLEIVDKKCVNSYLRTYKEKIDKRVNTLCICDESKRQRIYTGKILHLDGDRKYAEKSVRYYNKMGLNAVVKNIDEKRQPQVIIPLLMKYNPDILIITGHDAMLKKRKRI